MQRLLTHDESTRLEQLVDATGLDSVLYALSAMAHEKAEHIRSSYSAHDATARNWSRASKQMATVACACEDMAI